MLPKEFLQPGSVAVVGASRNPEKVGFGVFANLVQAGFPGPVYGVNPSGGEILGHRLETQACSICGIMRKKALVVGALQARATKLATGHNLDDEAQSVLMNVFRGDLLRLVRNSSRESSGKFIPRIKPLSRISEKDIATYLMLKDAWRELPECPYTRYAMRLEVRTMLSGFEYKHPGTMLHLLESKEKIERYGKDSVISEPLRSCRECGDPAAGISARSACSGSHLTDKMPDPASDPVIR